MTTTTEVTTLPPQVNTDPWFGVPWNNVAAGGSFNFVYLGNGWCLSAAHVGPAPWEAFGQLLNFGGVQNYNMIPGQNYVVPNPGGATLTDLRLVRIDGDPGLPALTIASQALTSANLGQAVADVTFVGLGNSRESSTSVWNGHLGYYGLGQNEGTPEYVKRWGRNQISNEDGLFGGGVDSNLRVTATTFVGKDINANVSLTGMVTTFDQNGVLYETQAIGGDSGSSVFHKNTSGQWELIGIVNAKCLPNNPDCAEPSNFAPYGDLTFFADLTYYRTEIQTIMNAHAADLPGDLNGDGKVDAADYVVWRNGLGTKYAPNGYDVWRAHFGETSGAGAGTTVLSASANSSSGSSGVPEPSSLILACGAAGFLLAWRKPSSRQTG